MSYVPRFNAKDKVIITHVNVTGVIFGPPQEEDGEFVYHVFFDDADQDYDNDLMSEGRLDFYCKNCKRPREKHAGDKCLYEATEWEQA